ncbi:MAG: sigma-70 family RNA polymerase sigma factor [Bauldia sp.]|nr:sigma-70 family RNA polymerase sigma factor [Bauldia sp.]
METDTAAPKRDGAQIDPAALSRLLHAVATERDRAAFAELFRHFSPRLKSYLLRLGGTAAGAEELVQETMVAVWRKADRYDPAKASASTWIFTIARNLRIDAYRRERHPEIEADDPVLSPDPVEAPDASLGREQDAGRLAEALARLSDGEQALLRMSFFDDLSHSVIAGRLGLPLGTVKSRIRLAFGKLRGALAQPTDDL